jgi:hypothetical protein
MVINNYINNNLMEATKTNNKIISTEYTIKDDE